MGIDQINNVATKGGSLQKQKKSRKETVNSNEGRSDVTYTGTLKRQKRFIIGDNKKEYCKNLEIDAMFSQAVADTFAVTTSAVSFGFYFW